MASTSIPKPSQEELDAYIGYRLIDTAIFFLILETVCVALRILSRRLMKANVGADDILVIPAFFLCASVPCVGIGKHADALEYADPERLVTLSKLILVLTCVYVWSAAIPKLVILALYLRVFTTPIYRRIIFVLGGVIIANLIGVFTAGLLQCTPFAYNWDTSIPGGHCFNRVAYFEFASLANIVTDLAMLVLPLRVVWSLHTDKSTKLGLTAIFLTGSIGLVTSIVRFSAFGAEDVFTDVSWATVNLTIFTIVEPGTYLIASCLPTYRGLLILFGGSNPNSLAPSDPNNISASSARRARIWLDRVFERTRKNNVDSSVTETEIYPFSKPVPSTYTAHAESRNTSSGRQSSDGYGSGNIRVAHELSVVSTS